MLSRELRSAAGGNLYISQPPLPPNQPQTPAPVRGSPPLCQGVGRSRHSRASCPASFPPYHLGHNKMTAVPAPCGQMIKPWPPTVPTTPPQRGHPSAPGHSRSSSGASSPSIRSPWRPSHAGTSQAGNKLNTVWRWVRHSLLQLLSNLPPMSPWPPSPLWDNLYQI